MQTVPSADVVYTEEQGYVTADVAKKEVRVAVAGQRKRRDNDDVATYPLRRRLSPHALLLHLRCSQPRALASAN